MVDYIYSRRNSSTVSEKVLTVIMVDYINGRSNSSTVSEMVVTVIMVDCIDGRSNCSTVTEKVVPIIIVVIVINCKSYHLFSRYSKPSYSVKNFCFEDHINIDDEQERIIWEIWNCDC